MKKLFLLLGICSLHLFLRGQAKDQITIGFIDSIQSKILKEERKLWIYLPPEYSPAKKYPVVYLLDGDLHFYGLVGLMRHFSYTSGNTLCPEMIVVGIPNTKRIRDLTPYKPNPIDPFIPPDWVKESGGGEEFISFIGEELIPYIESAYSTSPYRTLIGHSLGGLTVLHTLLHHRALFDAYLAIDPTSNWEAGRLLKEFRQASAQDNSLDTISLFMGIASLEMGEELEDILKDSILDPLISENIRSILAIDDFLKEDSHLGIRYESKFYKNETHTTVPLLSEYDGLRFIFDFYDLRYTTADWDDPDVNVAKKIEDHYKGVSEFFGYEVLPDEKMVNAMGYQFLSMQQLNKAGDLFALNVRLFPKHGNVYDSLGDYYAATDNIPKAIESYKKALSIEYHEHTRIKLEALEKE